MTRFVPHTTQHLIPRLDHGPMGEIRHIDIHINDGTTEGTLSWWASAGHEADGAHLQVSNNGHAFQCVPLDRMCWAEGSDNPHAISIEHEGWHTRTRGEWLTLYHTQLVASANRCSWLLHEHELGRPHLRKNIFGHGMGGAAWGGHPLCPGPQFPWDRYIELTMHGYMTHWGRL